MEFKDSLSLLETPATVIIFQTDGCRQSSYPRKQDMCPKCRKQRTSPAPPWKEGLLLVRAYNYGEIIPSRSVL